MERRSRPRTPGWTYGVVRWETGEQVSAIVWDISEGGVAVEVADDAPAASRFQLGLSCNGIQVAFSCIVASRDLLDGRPLIHARFDELTEARRQLLAALLTDWNQAMDSRQQWLITRRNDRASRANMTLPGDVRSPYEPRKAS